MCGRFLALSSTESLMEHFGVGEARTEPREPNYNVAPSAQIRAIIDHDGVRRLGELTWGFLPTWGVGKLRPVINARIETLQAKKMFSPAFRSHRCIVPADGFYEWQDRGPGRRKQPFHIASPDGSPLAFAGIHTRTDPGDPDRWGAAIVTTAARSLMATIHERMPVMLPQPLWQTWLDTTSPPAPHLLESIEALGSPALTATPIGAAVGSVRNNGPWLLEPHTVDDEDD